MTKILTDEYIRSIQDNYDDSMFDNLNSHFNSLKCMHYSEVVKEMNRIESLITEYEIGERFDVQEDSITDIKHNVIAIAAYGAALRSLSKILGLDYEVLKFFMYEEEDLNSEGLSLGEFINRYHIIEKVLLER